MKQLIELYERRLKNIKPLIESAKFDEDYYRELRLKTKASCYRAFISELKKIKQTDCDSCTVTGNYYLGVTCPKCGRPFRNVLIP